MMASEVIDQSVSYWRKKAREGTLTVEDMKLALAAIRAERQASSAVSAKSTTAKATKAAKAAPIDSDALLDGLKGLM